MKDIILILVFLIPFTIFNSCQEEINESESFETSFLKKLESSNLTENVLLIKHLQNSLKLTYEIQDGFENAFDTTSTAPIEEEGGGVVCKGTGVNFAIFCKNYLDKGHCLKTYKEGETYYAELISYD